MWLLGKWASRENTTGKSIPFARCEFIGIFNFLIWFVNMVRVQSSQRVLFYGKDCCPQQMNRQITFNFEMSNISPNQSTACVTIKSFYFCSNSLSTRMEQPIEQKPLLIFQGIQSIDTATAHKSNAKAQWKSKERSTNGFEFEYSLVNKWTHRLFSVAIQNNRISLTSNGFYWFFQH